MEGYPTPIHPEGRGGGGRIRDEIQVRKKRPRVSTKPVLDVGELGLYLYI